MTDPLAATCRALDYRQTIAAEGLDRGVALTQLRTHIAGQPPPADLLPAARATIATLMAYTVADMPPLTEDVSLLIDIAAFRWGLTTRGEVWRRIGIKPDTGRGLLSPLGEQAVTWPMFFTLRTLALGG
jgi:hypothetical protein